MAILGIIVVLLAIGISFLARYIHHRKAMRRAEAWEGVVTDKKRASPDGQNMYHYVTVELSNGQRKEVQIRGKMWKSLSPGDKVIKSVGSYDPVKVTTYEQSKIKG